MERQNKGGGQFQVGIDNGGVVQRFHSYRDIVPSSISIVMAKAEKS